MNYLITGGAGFIGSSLANRLAKMGHSITVVDDLSMGKRENLIDENIIFIEGDVCDEELMTNILESKQFDYVFLLAAIASVADSIERPVTTHNVNFESIFTMLELIRKTQSKLKRVVFSSSAAIYGDEPTLPKHEESVIRPLTPYAVDKFAAERYMLIYNDLYNIPTSAVRFFNVYGMNQNPSSVYSGVLSIITDQFKRLLSNETAEFTLLGDGEQSRDFVFIEDVLDALLLVAEDERAKGNVYNVGTGNKTTLNEVIGIFEEISRKSLPVKHKEARPGDIKESYANIEKLVSIGYKPNYSVYEGIKKYFEYEMSK